MENESSESNDSNKGLSAKTISKIFKFVSTGGIIICSVLKWIGVLHEATVTEICIIWSCIYGLGAGTIDLNIMFDKFTSK